MAQEYLDGQEVIINQGKVVGGGTVLNGMVWTRGSRKDYDAWDDLNNVIGRPKRYDWRWDDMLPYFRKVGRMSDRLGDVEAADIFGVRQNENFTVDVDDETRETYHIWPEEEVHGSDGLVQVSYPHYIYGQSGTMIPVINDPLLHGSDVS